MERVRGWLADKLPDRDVPAARPLRRGVEAEAIEAAVSEVFGVSAASVRRGGRHSVGRAAAMYLCRKLGGVPIAVLGERFGGVTGGAVSKASSRLGARPRRDRALARRLDGCERLLEQTSNVQT